MKFYLSSQYSQVRSRPLARSLKKKTSPAKEFRAIPDRETIPRQEFHVEPQKEVRSKRELRIDPIVKGLYQHWLGNYRHAKAEGSKRKLLPIGSLEKYYQARKKAFEVTTHSDGVHFDDGFDKIDLNQAVDGWRDLDSELEDHHLFYSPEVRPTRETFESNERVHYAKSPEQAKADYERFLQEEASRTYNF
ncbi:MAG: hypothetical protein ACYC7D_10405 [Nitrososphaerales archaeon]